MEKFNISALMMRDLVSSAKQHKRSITEQIEHWLRIGKVAEENPDLTYIFIKDTLESLEEASEAQLSGYVFDQD